MRLDLQNDGVHVLYSTHGSLPPMDGRNFHGWLDPPKEM